MKKSLPPIKCTSQGPFGTVPVEGSLKDNLVVLGSVVTKKGFLQK
jgi:hypothetical protein